MRVMALQKPWVKGQSGNPSGRPKLPKNLKAVKEFTTEEIRRIIAKYLRMTIKELQPLMLDKTIPMFEALIISVIVNSHKTGDFSKIEFLLNRSGHRQKDDKTLEVHQFNHDVENKRKDEIVKHMDEAEIIHLLSAPKLVNE